MMNNYLPNYYPQYQPVQVQPSVQSKIVDSFEYVTANDVPMDGNPAIFVKRDLSEVQLRKWGADGRIYTSSYKPQIAPQTDNVINVPSESKKSEYEAFNERLQAIEDKLDKLIKPTTAKKGVTDANS